MQRPAVLIVDDWLPLSEDASNGTFLSEDLLQLSNMAPEQIFTCNVKAEVVAALQACGGQAFLCTNGSLPESYTLPTFVSVSTSSAWQAATFHTKMAAVGNHSPNVWGCGGREY